MAEVMKKVPFTKWTAYGNNFVLIDEIRGPILTESKKSSFAYQATNVYYGVGSDNFLVVQPFQTEILGEINNVHHYWNECPDSLHADYIFRMFEPAGEEAFSCGNGLMCVANHLYQKHGVESARIITEIPTSKPKVVTIGMNPQRKRSWANMRSPGRIPSEMADSSVTIPYDDNSIDIIKEIPIKFRGHDLDPFSDETSMTLSGYLVFTGEPHFVIFIESGFSLENLANILFVSSDQKIPAVGSSEKRINFGSWLVHHIGTYLNRNYRHYFPSGINVNFVRVIHQFRSSGIPLF